MHILPIHYNHILVQVPSFLLCHISIFYLLWVQWLYSYLYGFILLQASLSSPNILSFSAPLYALWDLCCPFSALHSPLSLLAMLLVITTYLCYLLFFLHSLLSSTSLSFLHLALFTSSAYLQQILLHPATLGLMSLMR